jgi:hypothetical protein
MTADPQITLSTFTTDDLARRISELGELLHACVEDGASIDFVLPFRSLLTLDTRTGDHAEPLYRSLGFTTVGVIPGFCRDAIEDRLDSTTIMYKAL